MERADRISDLPVEIKISILCQLDIKSSIRTSVLARSWRHIWTFLPCLRLSVVNDHLDGIVSHYNFNINHYVVPLEWFDRVRHIVSSLRGPLLVFKLCYFFSDCQTVLLQSILDLLLQNGGLETLSFNFFWHQFKLNLPSFHSLKVLSLSACNVFLPLGFRGFNRLDTLVLKNVAISNANLHFLIHTSISLITFRALGVTAYGDPLSCNFSFPLLRNLEFVISDSVEEISIFSVPSLEQAEINVWQRTGSSLEMLPRLTLKLLSSVAAVSSLSLNDYVLKYLSLVPLPLNFTFPRLRSLKFIFDIWAMVMDKRMYNVFVWMLRSMPFLEELEVKLVDYSWLTKHDASLRSELVKKQNGFPCLDQTLRSVKIRMDEPDNRACMKLINFFLLNASVLKQMVIECWDHSAAVHDIIVALQKAKVASSNAKVVIFCQREKVTINVR